MIESSYSKLFSSIVTSTIWREDDKTRIVWITLLAIKNRHGQVAGSIPGLAAMANVSIPDCQTALEKLTGPDVYSRSKEFEGRRIEVIDGGWQILNHAKYRDAMSEAERREYQRQWQQKYRTEIKAGTRKPTPKSVDKNVDTFRSILTHTDTDTDTEAEVLPPESDFGEWELRVSRMYHRELKELKLDLKGKLAGARSTAAKTEWKRRLKFVENRLMGPDVPDEPPPSKPEQAPALCPETDWKAGIEALKSEVAAAAPPLTKPERRTPKPSTAP